MKRSQTQAVHRAWFRPSLTTQIMIGLVAGGAIGWLRPDWGNEVYFLRDIFINLIKSIIAPLVFSTIVVGIAGAGAMRKVGRMGVKALVYFEIVTTAALFIGLVVVNFTKPGVGVALAPASTDVVKTIAQNHPKTLIETLVHVFPSSVIESMARGCGNVCGRCVSRLRWHSRPPAVNRRCQKQWNRWSVSVCRSTSSAS